MKELETKGRSRKQRHHLFHKGMNQMKRLLSVCLFVYQYDQYQYWKYDGAGSNGSAVGKG